MKDINFIIQWLSNDLSAFGTILITVVALIIFILDISSKVNNNENKKAFWLFIAYLTTVLGLLLIILQSFKNITLE